MVHYQTIIRNTEFGTVNAKLTWFQPLIDRYREINRQEVVANLQAWIDRVTGTFASK
jgi:hypothetical protein